MKKVILSIALVGGIFATSHIQAVNNPKVQSVVMSVMQDDGFVNVKFEELNEKVQLAIRGLVDVYELNALQFNAEKQLTKVEATKKDDKTRKTFLFDKEGKEVVIDTVEEIVAKSEEETVEEVKQEVEETMDQAPSAEAMWVWKEDGFVDVKLEQLNEKVQAVVVALLETNELKALQHDAEKQITKVDVVGKEDQVAKTIYLNNEGVETTLDAQPAEQAEEQTQVENAEMK